MQRKGLNRDWLRALAWRVFRVPLLVWGRAIFPFGFHIAIFVPGPSPEELHNPFAAGPP
jgi:hypothetical protein